MTLLAGLFFGCVPEVDPCQGVEYDVRFEDRDGDGQGNRDRPSITCPALQPEGYVFDDNDCDDTDDRVFRYAVDFCDGLDNNCDGFVDNGLPTTDFFLDLDNDGFGGLNPVAACAPPPGTTSITGDCDDNDPEVNPEALERCDGLDNDCDGLIDQFDDNLDPDFADWFYQDGDDDGFGDPEFVVLGCQLPMGAVTNGDDCDDRQPFVFPGSIEVCNSIDDDCDGLIDDSDPDLIASTQRRWYLDADQDGYGDTHDVIVTCTTPWFRTVVPGDCNDNNPDVLDASCTYWRLDDDGDGFGAGLRAGPTCTPPGLDWVPDVLELDCDDARADVHPARPETCDGVDNDCDELVDDDDELDPNTTPLYQIDADRDGFGGQPFLSCTVPGASVSQGGDCDDLDAFVFPDATELCNGIDDNCNGLLDDDDPFLDPRDGISTYLDADGDGYGDPFSSTLTCLATPGRVELASDCDDSNPQLGPPTLWWPDQDGDNVGVGVVFGPSCEAPQPTWARVDAGTDCDDSQPTIFPGATEACDDGIDQDCDGLDQVCARTSCLEILEHGLSQGDAVYAIAPTGGPVFDVFCDMTTDGGGWTLVSSSNYPVDDEAQGYSANLASLEPEVPMNGIWDGLRPVIPVNSDIRFACRDELIDEAMWVDLVFYDIHWYRELTSGTDEEVCFNENNSVGYDQPAPARKDLISGSERERGNDWGSGYLEGEDSCTSRDDFTVDFDNRGMDGNQNDGTDWGEDDERVKCGGNLNGEGWYIFVR